VIADYPNFNLCGCGRLPNDCSDVAGDESLPLKLRLRTVAEHDDALAANEERSISEGWAVCPSAARARATSYRAAAKALRLEMSTGEPHCTCCLKPTGGCWRRK
jgi:hypothetical protein